jgi:hypothetical protein
VLCLPIYRGREGVRRMIIRVRVIRGSPPYLVLGSSTMLSVVTNLISFGELRRKFKK